jgi:hypothetical protein
MKTMKMILLAFVLLATACSQNTTTPTTPPATTNTCGYSTNSNQYIELKINGNTFRSESVMLNGAPFQTLACNFLTDQTHRWLSIPPLITQFPCNFDPTNTIIINNLSIVLDAYKTSNFQDPLGIYDKYANGVSSGGFSCYSTTTNTTKSYYFPEDSLTINVTNCSADNVSGTFVGTAFEFNWPTPIPVTGSFNNIKRNGF